MEQAGKGIVPNAKIAFIGLGYVGLPLAIEFEKKYDILGFDTNSDRVKELSEEKDRTGEADLENLKKTITLKKEKGTIGLAFSSDKEDLKNYITFIVTVSAPIEQFKEPDLMPLIKASEILMKRRSSLT